MTLLWLSIVAVCESLAFVWRYSAAVRGSALAQGGSTVIVCVLRVLFVQVGVSAMMRDVSPLLVIASYAIPAGVVTWWVARAKTREVKP